MSEHDEASRRQVYPFREDSALLLPWAELPSGRLLEVMCGAGSAAIAAARAGAFVVASDLNPYALAIVRTRSRGADVRVHLVRTDLFRGLGRFDRILANPPYLPTPTAGLEEDPWTRLALDGGPGGTRWSARIVREVPEHLRAGGALYLIASSLQSAPEWRGILDGFRDRGGEVRCVDRRALEGERLEVWEFRPTASR